MSSTFDDASLVFIPSGYKTSKAYSVKPSDGSGDLTFSRSNDTATRVNSAGLIEKVRTNVTLYSEQFDNAAWYKAGTTISANALTNPLNGASTADFVVEDTSTGTHDISPVSAMNTTNGVGYTFSVYAKADTRTKILLGLGGSSFNTGGNGTASFDLSSGSIITTAGSATATITSAGGGWYRCVITKIAALTGSFGVPYLQLLDASGNSSYTGNGSKVAGFGWQFETSDFGATPYIGPTLGSAVSVGPVANVPRLDYLGSTCGKLILEPQRTNLVPFSDGLQVVQAFGATLTKNQITSPDGYVNASLLTPSGGAAGITLMTGSFSGNYTVSVYLKGTVAGQKVRVFGDLQSTIADFTLTTSWARYTATFNSTNATGQSMYLLAGSYFSPSQNNPFYVYGAQIEAGAYATSYIPTLGAAVTRGADACSKTGISSLIGQTAGTIYLEVDYSLPSGAGGASARFQLSDGSTGEWILVSYPDAGSSAPRFYLNNGGSDTNVSSSANMVQGTNKIAAAYQNGDYVLYLNGVQVGASSASIGVPSTSRIDMQGNAPTDSTVVQGAFKQVLLFKTRLSNADLAALTA